MSLPTSCCFRSHLTHFGATDLLRSHGAVVHSETCRVAAPHWKDRGSPEFSAPGDGAQAFASVLYDRFPKMFILVRLFASVRFDGLPKNGQRLVEDKARAFGETLPVLVGTPVLALLGTRGCQPEWNIRQRSQRFRCLPLLSSRYVGSLSMFCLQLAAMGFAFSTLDSWEANTAAGRAGQWAGWACIANPAARQEPARPDGRSGPRLRRAPQREERHRSRGRLQAPPHASYPIHVLCRAYRSGARGTDARAC